MNAAACGLRPAADERSASYGALTPDEVRAIAKEEYLFGASYVDNHRV